MSNETIQQIDVPVRMPNGAVQWLPLAAEETPTFLIVVRPEKQHLLTTDDPNPDRIMVGAVTIEEAIGEVLVKNPKLCYGDILDHMEV